MSSESGDEAPIDAIQETAAVVVEGEPLPQYPETTGYVADPATDPAVGLTPPTLTGQDFEGNDVTIDPADGTPQVVVFAAHWCPHCQKEIPLIQEWIDEGSLPDGVEISLVSTSARADGPEYPPSEWLSGADWSSTVLLDNADQSAATVYGLTGFPYMVFIGADGTVTQRACSASCPSRTSTVSCRPWPERGAQASVEELTRQTLPVTRRSNRSRNAGPASPSA